MANEQIIEEKFVAPTQPCDAYYEIFTTDPDPDNKYQFLSTFEFKNTLLQLAEKSSKQVLDTGNGNPNFFSVIPRQSFSILSYIAAELGSIECKNNQQMGFMPEVDGISKKFHSMLHKQRNSPAKRFLTAAIPKMRKIANYTEDAFIYDLVLASLGSYYPDPPRIQDFVEPIIAKFCEEKVYGTDISLKLNLDVFPTEGATAAIIYIFNSLKYNDIVKRGDTIAILSPIYSSYLEIPEMKNYELKRVCIQADEDDDWEIPYSQLDKLADTRIKALLMVNPSNPTAVSLTRRTVERIKQIVDTRNPNLIIITDDVYAPFVDEYNTLFNTVPENTIGVYSLSKYFGVTGWRLGAILMHENNVIDRNLLPNVSDDVHDRYNIITHSPNEIKFIDRIVIDSRQVAAAHTAGLSTPQQTLMTLFAMHDLMDTRKKYKKSIKKLLTKRMVNLLTPIEYKIQKSPRNSNYYVVIDIIRVANNLSRNKGFGEYLQDKRHPLGFLMNLAKMYGTVILPGVSFAAPFWSIRICLASLCTSDYILVGNNIRNLLQEYYTEYREYNQEIMDQTKLDLDN